MSEITPYGSPLSLYTGRTRSYLINAGLSYSETLPNSSHYEEHVLPKMGGRRSIPAVETDEGEQTELSANTVAERGVGMCSFEARGVSMTALVQPYRFYLLSRVQQVFEKLDQPRQSEVLALLSHCGMNEILDLKLNREIGRHNNREVWL